MEFNNQNGAHVQNGTAKESNIKANQKGEAAKGSSNGKLEPEKPEHTPAREEQPGAGKQEQPKKAEAYKVEAKQAAEQQTEEVKPAKLVLNLESTLKVVNDLHRRSIQRINLIGRIKQLEAFEVALTQEHDELEENPYQGCKLIIEDDKKRQFITTTPGLIRLVSQFIFGACHEKLTEIEASIIFPNA